MSAARPGDGARYALPNFVDSRNGVLPVTLAGGAGSAVVLYTTADGGASWNASVVQPVPGPLEQGVRVPTDVVSSDTWVVATASGGRIFSTGDHGRNWKTIAPNGLPTGVTEIDFATRSEGWSLIVSGHCAGYKTDCDVTHEARLTSDGGQTWDVVRG
jgi:photosystem II stability/assembly factor-like uncharacterized protein